ncbi:hypothetical protein QTP88_002905 [Uroleucon formosanum]
MYAQQYPDRYHPNRTYVQKLEKSLIETGSFNRTNAVQQQPRQDGIPAHNARIVQEFLRVRFAEKFIATHGPVEWPPRSPDLTPLDFFCGDT